MEINASAETANTETILDELERVIRWSKEFTLAFVKCNHGAQCKATRTALGNRLRDRKILELELDKPISSLLTEIRRHLTEEATPDAVCLFGLENSISEQRGTSKILGSLNHERDLLRRLIPGALLIWVPDFALDLIARGAPDFWAWRSGVYEFPTQPELWQEDSDAALAGEDADELFSLRVEDKQKEIARLKGLLRTARALPRQDRRSEETIVRLLLKLGILHFGLGDLRSAQECFEQGLEAARGIGDSESEALSVHRLGVMALRRGEVSEAKRFFEKSLQMERELGHNANIAGALHQLGRVAEEEGNLPLAKRLFEESLEISRKLGEHAIIARTLHELGIIAQRQSNLAEARRLYQESLEMEERHGNEDGLASSWHQLGRIAHVQGDLAEAQRLYEQSLNIERKLGNRIGTAISLNQLGRLAEDQNRHVDASAYFRDALRIFEELKSPMTEVARRNLERLESR